MSNGNTKRFAKTLCAACKDGKHIQCNGKASQRIRNTGKKELDWYVTPCQCPCAPKSV